jgi:hypothetical protein
MLQLPLTNLIFLSLHLLIKFIIEATYIYVITIGSVFTILFLLTLYLHFV